MKTRIISTNSSQKEIKYPALLKDGEDNYVFASSATDGMILTGMFTGEIFKNDEDTWEESNYFPVEWNVTIEFIQD